MNQIEFEIQYNRICLAQEGKSFLWQSKYVYKSNKQGYIYI